MKKIEIHKVIGECTDKDIVFGTIEDWLAMSANGTYVLTLERKKTQRSISQNNLMWMWFEIIAEAWTDFGGPTYTRDDVHDYYCQLFLPISLPNGKTIGGSTSKLSTDEMTNFLNRVEAEVTTEFGITLPHPEDVE